MARLQVLDNYDISRITDLEGYTVIEETPPSTGLVSGSTGKVLLLGEFTSDNGEPDTPVAVGTIQEFKDTFGGWPTWGTTLWTAASGYNGSGYTAFMGKKWRSITVVSVDTWAWDAKITIDTSGGSLNTGSLKAGFRVQNAGGTEIFALLEDVEFATADSAVLPGQAVDDIRVRRITGVGVAPALAAYATADLPDWIDTVAGDTIVVTDGTNAAAHFAGGALSWTATERIAEYEDALEACLTDGGALGDVEIVVCAYGDTGAAGVNSKVSTHVHNAIDVGLLRMGIIYPPVNTAKATAKTDAANFDSATYDNVVYTYPGAIAPYTEISSTALETVGGPWTASIIAQTPWYFDPGYEGGKFSHVTGLATATGESINISDYIDFKAGASTNGYIAGLIREASGLTIYSDVNTCTVLAKRSIRIRRVKNYIEKGIIEIAGYYLKRPGRQYEISALEGDLNAFLSGLQGDSGTQTQQIGDYSLSVSFDNATGILTVPVAVQSIGSMKYIVFTTTIGDAVTVTEL